MALQDVLTSELRSLKCVLLRLKLCVGAQLDVFGLHFSPGGRLGKATEFLPICDPLCRTSIKSVGDSPERTAIDASNVSRAIRTGYITCMKSPPVMIAAPIISTTVISATGEAAGARVITGIGIPITAGVRSRF
jgi:hypothetical protein